MDEQADRPTHTPLIIPRAEHNVSRAHVSDNALKVLYRLKEAGYGSFLVGGCVRDLMLGREPKDFDVVTDARPDQIRALFRNARIIGRRFQLVHVHFGREIIEVATFRAVPHDPEEWAASDDVEDGEMLRDELAGTEAIEPSGPEESAEAMAPAEPPEPTRRAGRRSRERHVEPVNPEIFGSQEEDALRRDFTVNALYYDIRDFSVRDYVGGVADLQAGVLRMIGDPETRYREDPVRMLRVVRFAAKLGLRIEEQTAAPIRRLAHLLAGVPPARMFEEVLKLFHGGYALETYEQLRHYGLFEFLFPEAEESLAAEDDTAHFPHMLLPQALANTDKRIAEDKPVNPAFLFAAILWEPVRERTALLIANGMPPLDAQNRAAEEVLREQQRHVTIPKRFSFPMREIWSLQSRFSRRQGKNAFRLFENKRFRAAYDFLLLRAHAGEEPQELADWWTRFQEVDANARQGMIQAVAPEPGGGRPHGKRRRRRRGRKPGGNGNAA